MMFHNIMMFHMAPEKQITLLFPGNSVKFKLLP